MMTGDPSQNARSRGYWKPWPFTALTQAVAGLGHTGYWKNMLNPAPIKRLNQSLPTLSCRQAREGNQQENPTWPGSPSSKAEQKPGWKKPGRNPQSEPAAKSQVDTLDTVEALETLKQHLAFAMNEQERRQPSNCSSPVKVKLRIKPSLYKLLAKVDRKDFSTGCAKAAVFFGAHTSTIKDTGCLTSMLTVKKNIRDFVGREDSELEYLAGLEHFAPSRP